MGGDFWFGKIIKCLVLDNSSFSITTKIETIVFHNNDTCVDHYNLCGDNSTGQDMISKLLKMQMMSDDDELAYSPDKERLVMR